MNAASYAPQCVIDRYWLRLLDASMAGVDDDGRSYPRGCSVLIDPHLAPSDRRRVAVQLSSGGMIVRVYRCNGTAEWLETRPAQGAIEVMRAPFTIVGTVLAKFTPESDDDEAMPT